MKKLITLFLALSLAATVCFTAGCARQPTIERTSDIIQSYFKKYGKKFPESVLGQKPIQSVNVLHVEEIQKGLVAVYAILDLEDGIAMQTRFTIEKKPLMWRAVSWENMGLAMRQPTE